MNESANEYKKTEILGQAPLDLVIKVYDEAIANLRSASTHFENDDIAAGRKALGKTRNCVTHLYTTLDEEQGGEIADQLGKLYAFVINELNIIEGTKDPSRIEDNITVLNNLRLGWIGLKEQEADKGAAPEEQTEQASGSFVTSA